MSMKPAEALHYSRNLIVLFAQNAFFKINQIARVSHGATLDEIRINAYNFKQHFNCMIDYVIPPGQVKLHAI